MAEPAQHDWLPETEAERLRRQAREWTLADKLAWLEEITDFAAALHEQRLAQGLPCTERPPLRW